MKSKSWLVALGLLLAVPKKLADIKEGKKLNY